MRSLKDYYRVKRLAASGLSDYAVARETGIPRPTVRNWRQRTAPPRGAAGSETSQAWRPSEEPAYAYLLGLYLGDGNIWRTGHASWRLCLTLDFAYPGIVESARRAVADTAPSSKVRLNTKGGESAITVLCSSRIWPQAFPQHAPGTKHERSIRLEPWQDAITQRHPRSLIRGLIHSDGCRTINRFRTALPSGRVAEYAYPHFFTNLSADIRGIFCRHCELVGVRWSQSNARNISVADRRSVAILDSFVGPKS